MATKLEGGGALKNIFFCGFPNKALKVKCLNHEIKCILLKLMFLVLKYQSKKIENVRKTNRQQTNALKIKHTNNNKICQKKLLTFKLYVLRFFAQSNIILFGGFPKEGILKLFYGVGQNKN